MSQASAPQDSGESRLVRTYFRAVQCGQIARAQRTARGGPRATQQSANMVAAMKSTPSAASCLNERNERQNKRMHRTKPVSANGATAFAGDPQRSAD